jgi:hypothetical protein
MPRFTPKTKAFTMPDLVDRFGLPFGNPPDGYVVTYSAVDGYYYPKPTSKLQIISAPVSSPYNATVEDVVLVQTHAGTFTVNLPVGPPQGTKMYIKDFAGVATVNPINVVSGANIDGTGTYSISINYGAVELVYSGTTWSILSKY